MRVLVVDDERPCLNELCYLLSKQESMEIAGAFTSALDALEASLGLNIDAAFLDLSMSDMDGAELAARMHAHSPGLKIVFVTAYVKELAKLKDSPAIGGILKPVSEAKLREVLRWFEN